MSTRTASRPIEAAMIDPSLGLPTITMAVPMPGFPAHREFVLVRLNDDGLLYAFTSIQDPELRFLVAPPEPFFPDYAPEIENEVFAALNTKDPDRLLLMTVITAGVDETTANLLAPIVVDRDTMRAMQVVLSGSGYPVRAIMHRAYWSSR
jgi:flagellar assembly factor FliW